MTETFLRHAGDFERDGVVLVRDALDDGAMSRIEALFEDHFRGTHAYELYPREKGRVLEASGASARSPADAKLLRNAYAGVLATTPIADIARGVFRGQETYYFGTQLWFKETGTEGEPTRRTPWHQDTSYFPFEGLGYANLWIPLEDLAATNVLEVVSGSHRGPVFNATGFDPNDETLGLYDDETYPPFPDIDADRGRWNIVADDMRRGDVLVFHPACLHGGAPTFAGQRRRTLSFRFFSESAIYSPRPEIREDNEYARRRKDTNEVKNHYEGIVADDPLWRSMAFEKVRPRLTESSAAPS